MKHRFFLWSCCALAFCASPAYAEVMDKEPAPNAFWWWSLPGAVLGFLTGRFFPRWSALTLLIFIALALFGMPSDIFDSQVNRSMRSELGSAYPSYVLQFYAPLLVTVFAHVCGWISFRRHQRLAAKTL